MHEVIGVRSPVTIIEKHFFPKNTQNSFKIMKNQKYSYFETKSFSTFETVRGTYIDFGCQTLKNFEKKKYLISREGYVDTPMSR